MVPQFLPEAAQVVGVQTAPQTFSVPLAPHAEPTAQAPQSSVWPHPSGMNPQVLPSAAQVVGEHTTEASEAESAEASLGGAAPASTPPAPASVGNVGADPEGGDSGIGSASASSRAVASSKAVDAGESSSVMEHAASAAMPEGKPRPSHTAARATPPTRREAKEWSAMLMVEPFECDQPNAFRSAASGEGWIRRHEPIAMALPSPSRKVRGGDASGT